jgi:hypothetical protein
MTNSICADDVLVRKSVANDLERLISFGLSVINIDAPYGSGKTFLTRLKEQLSGSGYHCISIDAWGGDYDSQLTPDRGASGIALSRPVIEKRTGVGPDLAVLDP